jgi:hypothetical protein
MEILLSGLESDVNLGIVAFRLSPPLYDVGCSY